MNSNVLRHGKGGFFFCLKKKKEKKRICACLGLTCIYIEKVIHTRSRREMYMTGIRGKQPEITEDQRQHRHATDH